METFDVIIRGGLILDGTGSDGFAADVGVRDDRIEAVGDLSQANGAKVISASGRRVAPGFIDIHTHSDISATYHPEQESMLAQGVTTQVVGNCSLSMGLALNDERFAFERRWLKTHGAGITWNGLDEHLKTVEDRGIGTNYVMLAGQGTLRKRVVGLDDRPPTTDEMDEMKRILRDAFESGVWGISTGLEYTPSSYAGIQELVELSKVAAEYGGFYASHLRSEGDRLEEAVAEALEIGERAGIPVQLSHHKAEGRRNWGKVVKTLAMVDSAVNRGMDVMLDQYPYTAFQTSLAVQTLPSWANVGDNEAVLSRLKDPEIRRHITADILASHADWDDPGPGSVWESVEIGVARIDPSLQGKSIAALSRARGIGPIDCVLDIILEQQNFVSAVNFGISEEDVRTVMQHPLTMIGSDSVGAAPRGKMWEEKTHPRSYGTFPRVLGIYVRESGVLTESAAIRKMTSMPADRLGLPNRGRISPGQFADIVIYDAATISDRATFEIPHQFAAGVDCVLVNGRIAWESGARTDALAGSVMRKRLK